MNLHLSEPFVFAGRCSLLPNWFGFRFARQFDLKRLVAAVVFLGALMGLNHCRIELWTSDCAVASDRICIHFSYYNGWPLPIAVDERHWEGDPSAVKTVLPSSPPSYSPSRYPWTHQGYCLLETKPFQLATNGTKFRLENSVSLIAGGLILNSLFAFAVLNGILFLQIPRRKVVAKGE